MLQTTLRITNSSDIGITGLTSSNIKFKTPGGVPITVGTISGGTNGVYLVSFIGVAYQPAQLFIDDVYQGDWGTKYIGDTALEYLSITKTTEQDIKSDLDMNSKILKNLNSGTASGHSVQWGQVVHLTGDVDETIEGEKIFKEFPKKDYEFLSDLVATLDDQLMTFYHVRTLVGSGGAVIALESNDVLVDDKIATNVTGKKYKQIDTALSWITSQTRSASIRYRLLVMPHSGAGYTQDIVVPRFVEMIALGRVKITGGLDSSAETWDGYNSEMTGFIFDTVDKAIYIKNIIANLCDFKANGAGGEVNLIVDGAELNQCGLWKVNDVNTECLNTARINRVDIKANFDMGWLATDEVYNNSYITSGNWIF